jgi:hypothetical protein
MNGEELLRTIQRIAYKERLNSKPCDFVLGTVVSEEYEKLQIQISDKIILTEAFLVLTNAVQDHFVDVEIYSKTIDDNDLSKYQNERDANVGVFNAHTHAVTLPTQLPVTGAVPAGTTVPFASGEVPAPLAAMTKSVKTSHLHNIAGRKKIRIYNGLHKGESVLLLRAQGGNTFVVLDRTSEYITGGEWEVSATAGISDQTQAPFEVSDASVLAGWKEDMDDPSNWPRASKPAKFDPSGEAPE